MAVHHGFACAESRESDRQKPLRIDQRRSVPHQLNRATVLLSGWRFQYLNGDNQMRWLGTGIFNIRREGDILRWEAWGALMDRHFDDPYRWCYHYTVLAWNRAVYAADPDHRDAYTYEDEDRTSSTRWETALSFHPNYTETPYYFLPNSAVLPRGFALGWRGVEGGGDHNLLQLAYNLDYSENFIADGKRYVQDSPYLGGRDLIVPEFRSWETKTILKDNALKRRYVMGEVISILYSHHESVTRGMVQQPSFTMVQPPFTIVPAEDRSNCVAFGDPAGQTRIVETVPLTVAVPVLTGWDLSYVCDDQHVEEIGIWIDSFTYARDGSAYPGGGRLQYTVNAVLHDDDSGEANLFRHKVGVLGFELPPQFIDPDDWNP